MDLRKGSLEFKGRAGRTHCRAGLLRTLLPPQLAPATPGHQRRHPEPLLALPGESEHSSYPCCARASVSGAISLGPPAITQGDVLAQNSCTAAKAVFSLLQREAGPASPKLKRWGQPKEIIHGATKTMSIYALCH